MNRDKIHSCPPSKDLPLRRDDYFHLYHFLLLHFQLPKITNQATKKVQPFAIQVRRTEN